MKYNKQIAEKLYSEYNIRLSLAKKQYDYYKGKTDIINNYPVTDRSNRKVNDNYIRTFIEEEVSFMVGQPITYVGEEEVVRDIYYNLNNINSTLDTELCTNLLIYGEAYELYYIYDNEFKVKELSPINSIAYCDTENKCQLFMYFYHKELDDSIYFDVIDDNYIYHFKDGFIQISEPTEHYFGSVPVSVARLNHGSDDTLYNNIKLLQDAYEYTLSDWSNEISDTRLSYLVLSGISIDDDDAKKMKQMGILQLPEANGKAEWLIKNINSDFVKNYRDIIKEDIYRVANHIDNQEGVQSNTSGTMLITRLNCLRLKIIGQNQCIKSAIRIRLKHLFTYINLIESKAYDYRLVRIEPQLNLPANDIEIAQIMSQLNGKLSIRTGLSKLSFVQDADLEFNKMLEEQKMIDDNLSSINLDKEVDIDE